MSKDPEASDAMKPDDYQSKVKEFERPSPHGRLAHAVLGMSSEVGELAALIKRDDNPNPADVMDEAGDVLYYATLALASVGVDLESAMSWNYAKLRRRAEHGKDKESERDAMLVWAAKNMTIEDY